MTVDSPSKPRSSREDVLQFLDSLDSYSTPPRTSTSPADPSSATGAGHHSNTSGNTHSTSPAPGATTAGTGAEEAQSVLDFLDEITQRSSTPTAPVKKTSSANIGLSRSSSRTNVLASSVGASSRKSGESIRSRSSGEPSPLPTSSTTSSSASSNSTIVAPTPSAPAPAAAAEASWGWSSVWSQASNVVQQASHVVQQARTVAEEQVKTNAAGLGGIGEGLMKALGENEQAKKWSEGVVNYAKGADFDKIGKDLKSTTLRSLTELLNAVAPPIAEHEVLQVSLSHDMIGYEGVETLVYSSLSKVMEHIEGGSLVVNQGDEAKPRPTSEDPDERELNAVEGLAEGWKLAHANLEELIKKTYIPEEPAPVPGVVPTHTRHISVTIPVTTCPIYIRIQPVLAPLPFTIPIEGGGGDSDLSLFFLFVLRDPGHNLSHSSLSQSLPRSWLDVPFEENEWVEDMMVDVLRKGIEVVGKEYIDTRMHAQGIAINKAREAAQQALNQPVEEAPVPEGKEEAATVAVASTRAI